MSKVISALEARNKLGTLIDQATISNVRFIIKKRKKPSVVLLNYKDYLRNILKQDPDLEVLQKEAKKKGLAKLTNSQINQLITDTRLSND